MKILILLAFAIISVNAHAASRKEVKKFFKNLKGEYELVKNENTADNSCAQKLEIDTILYDFQRKIRVENIEEPSSLMAFARIGKKKNRTHSEAFTVIDSIYELSEDRKKITYKTRRCKGIVFYKCENYTNNSSFRKIEGEKIEIWVGNGEFSNSSPGFPRGTCTFKKLD